MSHRSCVFVMVASILVAGMGLAEAAPAEASKTPAASAKPEPAATVPSAASSEKASVPEERVYFAEDEADSVATTGHPGCTRGRMVLTFQPDAGFLEDGATFRTEEVGFAVGEAARAGKLSCLIIQATAYDRAMFLKLRDDYAAPNGVSLMWIPKSP